MTIFLPWGLLNVIAELFKVEEFPIFTLSLALAFIEGMLIYFEKYPKFLKLSRNERVNALVFYLMVNTLSNIISFLWI